LFISFFFTFFVSKKKKTKKEKKEKDKIKRKRKEKIWNSKHSPIGRRVARVHVTPSVPRVLSSSYVRQPLKLILIKGKKQC
jgi:hypothetical protein